MKYKFLKKNYSKKKNNTENIFEKIVQNKIPPETRERRIVLVFHFSILS